MRFCSKEVQDKLLKGGIIRRKYDSNNYLTLRMSSNRLETVFGDSYILRNSDLESNEWEIASDDWDWEAIITLKILCVFWNTDDDNYAIGTLVNVLNDTCHKFVSKTYANNTIRSIHWNHCEPLNNRDYVIGNIENLRKFVK